MRLTLREFAGGLGDLGTFLPLSLALSVACGLHLGWLFILAGLMNVSTGVLFNQPIPVQPMKAIGTIAVAAGLSSGEVMASGICMGLLLVLIACWGGLDAWVKRIPQTWIAVIQAGVGLKLAALGVSWVIGWDLSSLSSSDSRALPWWGMNSIASAGLVCAMLLLCLQRQGRLLSAVVPMLVIAGGCWALRGNGSSVAGWQPPPIDVQALLDVQTWQSGFVMLALPQLPLTLLNSVIAVCGLSAIYEPARPIAPRRMAMSVGMMNLIACPLGGMPMCHGAGGLAAQHAFGARTGGSVVMLGAVKVFLALALMPWLPGIVAHYPQAVLGPMVVIAGLRLAASAKPVWAFGDSASRCVLIPGAAGVLWLGSLPGLLIAVTLWLAIDRSALQARGWSRLIRTSGGAR